jgi:transposase
MEVKIKQHRILAVQRFKNGESPESICTSLGKSKFWLYKWVKRHNEEETSWCDDRSRRPITVCGAHLRSEAKSSAVPCSMLSFNLHESINLVHVGPVPI